MGQFGNQDAEGSVFIHGNVADFVDGRSADDPFEIVDAEISAGRSFKEVHAPAARPEGQDLSGLQLQPFQRNGIGEIHSAESQADGDGRSGREDLRNEHQGEFRSGISGFGGHAGLVGRQDGKVRGPVRQFPGSGPRVQDPFRYNAAEGDGMDGTVRKNGSGNDLESRQCMGEHQGSGPLVQTSHFRGDGGYKIRLQGDVVRRGVVEETSVRP